MGSPWKGPAELPARVNVELEEHLPQVPLHRARAEEELGADLRVRMAGGGESRDLLLLRGQLVPCLVGAFADLHAGRGKLAASPLGERAGAEVAQTLVGTAGLLACVHAPAFPSQPLAVEQVCAGELGADRRAAEPSDRFFVQRPCGAVLAPQRP